MYQLGRTLQFAGLVILPLAVLMQIEGQLTLGKSLALSAFGVVLFSFGYVLQGLRGSS